MSAGILLLSPSQKFLESTLKFLVNRFDQLATIDMTDNKSSKEAKDFDFLLTMVKTGTVTFNYEEAAAKLGGTWTKKKVTEKICRFRKEYDWPINNDAPKAAAKPLKPKASKRAADDGELKKPTVKRVKANKKAAKIDNEGKDEESLVAEEDVENFDEGGEHHHNFTAVKSTS